MSCSSTSTAISGSNGNDFVGPILKHPFEKLPGWEDTCVLFAEELSTEFDEQEYFVVCPPPLGKDGSVDQQLATFVMDFFETKGFTRHYDSIAPKTLKRRGLLFRVTPDKPMSFENAKKMLQDVKQQLNNATSEIRSYIDLRVQFPQVKPTMTEIADALFSDVKPEKGNHAYSYYNDLARVPCTLYFASSYFMVKVKNKEHLTIAAPIADP